MSDAALSPDEVIGLIAEQIVLLGPATTTIGGSIRFTVPGSGDWVVSLDAPHGRWAVAQGSTEADVTIVIGAEHIASLFTAPETLEPLAARGEIAVSGDIHKLAALGTLLAQRGSLLRQRTGPGANHSC